MQKLWCKEIMWLAQISSLQSGQDGTQDQVSVTMKSAILTTNKYIGSQS